MEAKFMHPPAGMKAGPTAQPTLPIVDEQAIAELLRYKILIHSLSGVGKSSLAMSIQQDYPALLLDCERGTLAHTGRIVRLTDWNHFIKVTQALTNQKHNYRVVTIDPLDALYNMAWSHTIQTLGVTHPAEASHGKGYDRITSAIFDQLNKLQLSGLGLVCTAHTMTGAVKIRNIEYTNFQPSFVGGSPRSAYQRMHDFFDIIGFMRMESMAKPEKDVRTIPAASQITEVEKRVLEFQPSKFWVTKDRTGRFKEAIVLPDDWREDWRTIEASWNWQPEEEKDEQPKVG